MTADEFVMHTIDTWGDWPTKNPDGSDNRREIYKKERFIKKVNECYTETELDILWDIAEAKCKYRLQVHDIVAIMEGSRKPKRLQAPGFVYERNVFGLRDEYTTEAGRWFGKHLRDFMKSGAIDNMGTLHQVTEDERQQFIIRSSVYWDKLLKLMQRIPISARPYATHPERCAECGRRIGREREANELYCRECGNFIGSPLGVVMDMGGGNVAEMLAGTIKTKAEDAIVVKELDI